MQPLSWELSILARSIAYENLSGAAQHVGLSQPQLSRIVTKIEKELEIPLLDRRSKRNSSWTPQARLLVETYQRTERTFKSEVLRLSDGTAPQQIRMGILEGLIPNALELLNDFLKIETLKLIEIDVYDLGPLEERFYKGVLDLILTIREPGRRKPNFVSKLGYQSIDRIEGKNDLCVYSNYEYGILQTKDSKELENRRVIISNSLLIRNQCIEKMKATGTRPSAVTPHRSPNKPHPVLLIGNEALSPALWKSLSALI